MFESRLVDEATLSDARRIAQHIFSWAGLETNWIYCKRSQRDRRCREPIGPTNFLVRIVDQTNVPQESLSFGYAHLDTTLRTGVLASIYGARVKRTAARLKLDPAVLLGRVLAHEVGHLLGVSAHSVTGIMRADWSDEVLRREKAAAFLFMEDQPAMLRAGIAARVAATWHVAE